MQLVHCATETTWEDHGFVRIRNASGKILSEIADYQHDRCFLAGERQQHLITKLMMALGARYPCVRKAPLTLGDKGGKQRMAEERMAILARVGEATQTKDYMRHSPEESVQRASRRSASVVRSGNENSALARHGQHMLQYRRRSNSTSR